MVLNKHSAFDSNTAHVVPSKRICNSSESRGNQLKWMHGDL